MQMQAVPKPSTVDMTRAAASELPNWQVKAMSAPRRASAIAVAEPIPPLPPVIRQTFLLRSMTRSLTCSGNRERPGETARPPRFVLQLFGDVNSQPTARVHLPVQRLGVSEQLHRRARPGDHRA